jgi:hypothetical protein
MNQLLFLCYNAEGLDVLITQAVLWRDIFYLVCQMLVRDLYLFAKQIG